LAGGVLIPMAFTLIMILRPPLLQPVGIAMCAMAATVAPSIGPTLGGWLSATLGWQTIFYITIPPGLLMIALLAASLERAPMQLGLLRQGDWLGMLAMALGLGSLQIVLEEGEREDWFDSTLIVRLAAIAILSLALFVWIELRSPQPLVNLRLLTRRNFLAGAAAMFLLGVALFGSVFIQPLYLSRVQGYSSHQIGLVLAWTGLPQFLVIPLVPLLMKRLDPRCLVAVGFALFAASNLLLIDMSRDVAADQMLVPDIVRALGLALVVTPLMALAVAGIEAADAPSASSLLTITRNLGGAIGIAVLQTFLSRREQFHASRLSEALNLFDAGTRARLDELAQYFMAHGAGDPPAAWREAVAEIAARVHEQASVMAFADTFLLMGAAMIAALATATIYGRPKIVKSAAAH